MAAGKRRRRIVAIVVIALLLVVVIGGAAIYLNLGRIVKTGIEVGGPKVLGVETKVSSVSISLLGGSFDLRGLHVGNPQGFESPRLFGADRIRVEAELASLARNEVHLRNVTVDAPEITLEVRGLRTNLGALLEQLKAKAAKAEPAAGAKPVLIRIDRLRIAEPRRRLYAMGGGVTQTLPTIEITDIKGDDGRGVPPDRLASVILERIYVQVAASAKDALPAKEIQSLAEGIAGGPGISSRAQAAWSRACSKARRRSK